MGRVNPDSVRLVESVLKRKMSNVLVTSESSYIGGIDPLIGIIQRTDRQTEKVLLESIEEQDPKLAETIRSQLFLFEDIKNVDDRSLQLILREVNPQDLAHGAGQSGLRSLSRNYPETQNVQRARYNGIFIYRWY